MFLSLRVFLCLCVQAFLCLFMNCFTPLKVCLARVPLRKHGALFGRVAALQCAPNCASGVRPELRLGSTPRIAPREYAPNCASGVRCPFRSLRSLKRTNFRTRILHFQLLMRDDLPLNKPENGVINRRNGCEKRFDRKPLAAV